MNHPPRSHCGRKPEEHRDRREYWLACPACAWTTGRRQPTLDLARRDWDRGHGFSVANRSAEPVPRPPQADRGCPSCGARRGRTMRREDAPALQEPHYAVSCDACGHAGPWRLTIERALTAWLLVPRPSAPDFEPWMVGEASP